MGGCCSPGEGEGMAVMLLTLVWEGMFRVAVFLFFIDTRSHCSPGWPQTGYVAKNDPGLLILLPIPLKH